MFALSDVARFEGEKGTYKMFKPVWDVITDYLMMFLAMLSVLFAGMEIAFGSFECLAAVDCPGISNTNSSLFSRITNRNVCEAFYSSQKTNTIKRTDVLIDLSRQYAKFVNLECSKSAIPDFLSYLSIVLFIQAFVLIVLDNVWLKLPTTASVIEHFSALVIACYGSSCPNFELTQAVSDIPVKRRCVEDPQQDGQNIEMDPISDRNSDHILDDPATTSAVKTLYEKVQTLKKNLIKSSQKFVNIRRLYLVQAILQAILTFAFILIDSLHFKDLKETITCSITQHIPVPHDYFLCSHGLAPAFAYGLYVYIAILLVSFVTFLYIIGWAVCKVAKDKCKYDFNKENLPLLVGTVLSDIDPVEEDFGFLLHLLHSYNNLYVVRLAPFLSEGNEKKTKAYNLMNEYPVSKLRRQLNENKLNFTNCRGIPETIFELATEIIVLELIECKPLENEDFKNFWKLTSLRVLLIVKCGLDSIPDGILNIEWLKVLNLKENSITSIKKSISRLKNLDKLDLSYNGLKTIDYGSFDERNSLFAVDLSGNPELEISALQVVLACRILRNLRYPQHLSEKLYELSQKQRTKLDAAVNETYVIPYTPEDAPHIHRGIQERIYKMDSNATKGIAIIFNVDSFKKRGLRRRSGSDKDVSNLKLLFENIGFETKCCIDYGAEKAMKVLQDYAVDTTYEGCDCIAVVIMSHGTEEGIIFHDGNMVSIMDLVECVQKSSIYNGKPKLFFIQASRGDLEAGKARNSHYDPPSLLNDVSSLDQGTVHSTSSDINTDALGDGTVAPKHMVGADILLVYSTGYEPYQNTEYGSWFVQALFETFSRCAWEEDILRLLSLVNYNVVRAWKQVPVPATRITLRKKLYLLPGYPPQQSTAPPGRPTAPPRRPTALPRQHTAPPRQHTAPP
jgi:hypothetical protein